MTQLHIEEREEYEAFKRRDTDRDTVNIKWSMVFQIIGYVLGLFVIYNALTNRMTALEVQAAADRAAAKAAIDSMKGDLSEVKSDVKTLLRRTP